MERSDALRLEIEAELLAQIAELINRPRRPSCSAFRRSGAAAAEQQKGAQPAEKRGSRFWNHL
jgi:hypothetical protein